MQAWGRIGQLRDSQALGSWVYGIARNLSRLQWRRNGAHKETFAGADAESDEFGLSGVENAEELVKLRKAITELPLRLRETVVLHYMQHLSISEAAKAVGVGEGTFKSRLNRALKALRKVVS
jgi:RNA polymerase sigma-70 factor (ECF subfamily)